MDNDIKLINEIIHHKRKSKYIMDIFDKYSGDNFEIFKHEIDQDTDHIDILTVFDYLNEYEQEKFINKCQQNIFSDDLKLKIISDIDNTFIEAPFIAKNTYKTDIIIPGYMDIVKSMTKLPITFISARPKILENKTINKISSLTNYKFSVLTGSVLPLIYEGVSWIIYNKLLSRLSHKKIAEGKYYNFIRWQKIFPHNKFLFFGDDSQGDHIFARKMIDRFPDALACIRRVMDDNIESEYIHPNIFYHRSYFHIIVLFNEYNLTNINDDKNDVNDYIDDDQYEYDCKCIGREI